MYRCNLLLFVIYAIIVKVIRASCAALMISRMWRIRWCVIQVWGWLLWGEVRSDCPVPVKVCCVLIGYYSHDMYLSFLAWLMVAAAVTLAAGR